MNKKKNIIALALSVSFVMGAGSISHADEINSDATSYANENYSTENENKSSNKSEDKEIKNVTEVKNNSDTKENQNIEISEEKPLEAQGAGENQGQNSTDPNYADDEKEIKDFNESERYRSTQMEQGNGPTDTIVDTPDMESKDGFSYKTLEPSATSEDKTQWGIEMEFDKDKGQRTYTDFGFTNTGNMAGVLDPGTVPSKDEGDKLSDKGDFKEPNYKAGSKIDITGSRSQRNLNLYATEEDLEHINNKDNKNTIIAWEGKYKKDNPDGLKATQGSSSAFTFTVNPWPNENDKLELIKLNGKHDKKEFVQGQEITTGVKVENLDENARERLVGQVYHPITGEVVEGAKAYINDEGFVVIKMPDGAVNEDGTINENSIFYKDPKYKGIQNLEVKFFARPRTADEFRTIIDNNGGIGYYTSTGAGTRKIIHDGKEVEVDLQGIDRYDHYNLIGGFKLNLDDTRYYDQGFINEDKAKTENHTFNDVKAGIEYEIKGIDENTQKDENLPNITGDNPKTSEEMQGAVDRGEASATIDQHFIDKQNEKLNPNDRWVIKPSKDGDVSNFKVTPPKTSQPGDHFSVPVIYTYTNGSTDVHWFHFVVQKTENPDEDVPSYNAKAGFEGTKLSSNPKFEEGDEGKPKPSAYILEETTYTDEKGNKWQVSIDENGVVTTTVPEGNIKGGENIEVPVKIEYTDEEGNKKYEYKTVQFFAMPKEDEPVYKQEVTKVFESDIPYETKVVYDDTLEAGKVVETKGTPGKMKTTFMQVVINGKKGIINENGEFVEGEEKIIPEKILEKVDGEVRIGTKPAETTVEIPFDTEYELDYTKKKGEAPTEIESGEKGEVTVKTKRDPKTGKITVTQEETKAPKNRKISIPAGSVGEHEYSEEKPFKYKVEFDPDFYKNYPDAKENYKIVVEGKAGTKTTKWKIENSQIVGKPEITETEPVDAVIKVGMKNEGEFTVEKEIGYKVIIKEDPNLDAGVHKVEREGENGKAEVNVKFKDGKKVSEDEKVVKEAIDKIILIGTKPNNNMCPIPEDPQTPEEPKDPENPKNPEEPKDPQTPQNPKDSDKPKTQKDLQKPDDEKPSRKLKRINQDVDSKVNNKNPKTGITSLSTVLATLGVSISSLAISKKKRNK